MWHIPWWYISMALKVRPPQSSPIYLSIYITESTRTRLDGKHRPGKETYVFVIRIKLEKTEKERCIVRPSADIYSILRRIATVTIAVTISCPNHVHMSCHVMSCSRQGHDRLIEKKFINWKFHAPHPHPHPQADVEVRAYQTRPQRRIHHPARRASAGRGCGRRARSRSYGSIFRG